MPPPKIICRSISEEGKKMELFSVHEYREPLIEKIIEQFKFRGGKPLARLMAKEMIRMIDKEEISDVVFIPIPLHWTRKIWRGYNQSEALLMAIKKENPRIKIQTRGLKRIRKTAQQSKLNREERLKNLQNAFEWQGEEIPQKIVLLDDVIATGSTLLGAAEALKKAGCQKVYGLTFAYGSGR